MILKIVAVGKLREKHWRDAVSDYIRRLRPYGRLEMVEVSEARIPERASLAEERAALDQEAFAILEKLKDCKGPVIVLDRQGIALDSVELSEWMQTQILDGKNEMAWVVGGPLGLGSTVLDRSDLILSFSRMTFPHQMMRPILLEQIYRSFRIMHHEPYHK